MQLFALRGALRGRFVAAVVATLFAAGPAMANCGSAKPGVNWVGCTARAANYGGANLAGADLRRIFFTSVNLGAANLSGAKLAGARFVSTNFSQTNLSRANLTGAVLSRSNLLQANFRYANLTRVAFDRSNLFGADFSHALWVDGRRRCRERSIGRCILR